MSIDPFGAESCYIGICDSMNRSLHPAVIVTLFLDYVIACWNSQ